PVQRYLFEEKEQQPRKSRSVTLLSQRSFRNSRVPSGIRPLLQADRSFESKLEASICLIHASKSNWKLPSAESKLRIRTGSFHLPDPSFEFELEASICLIQASNSNWKLPFA